MNIQIASNFLQTTLLFLSIGILTIVAIMSYELSTNGIMIAGDYHIYYISDVLDYIKRFFTSW